MRRRRIKSQSEDPHYCKGHGEEKLKFWHCPDYGLPTKCGHPRCTFTASPPPPPNEHDVQDVNTMNIFLNAEKSYNTSAIPPVIPCKKIPPPNNLDKLRTPHPPPFQAMQDLGHFLCVCSRVLLRVDQLHILDKNK